MKIIELSKLSKSYRHLVLNNINYCFETSKLYLIVGENGCGKSTLIKTIIGLIKPRIGLIHKSIKDISYVPDSLIFPDFVSIDKFLYNLGLIYGINKVNLNQTIKCLLDKFCINGKYKLNELSKGMKQKVLIIQALLKDGPVYIFDEPLNGLDKDMKKIFINVIQELRSNNKTIIIISHETNEFYSISDIILEIKDGNLYEKFN